MQYDALVLNLPSRDFYPTEDWAPQTGTPTASSGRPRLNNDRITAVNADKSRRQIEREVTERQLEERNERIFIEQMEDARDSLHSAQKAADMTRANILSGHVSCPTAARIVQVHVLPGQWVSRGAPLVTIVKR